MNLTAVASFVVQSVDDSKTDRGLRVVGGGFTQRLLAHRLEDLPHSFMLFFQMSDYLGQARPAPGWHTRGMTVPTEEVVPTIGQVRRASHRLHRQPLKQQIRMARVPEDRILQSRRSPARVFFAHGSEQSSSLSANFVEKQKY